MPRDTWRGLTRSREELLRNGKLCLEHHEALRLPSRTIYGRPPYHEDLSEPFQDVLLGGQS